MRMPRSRLPTSSARSGLPGLSGCLLGRADCLPDVGSGSEDLEKVGMYHDLLRAVAKLEVRHEVDIIDLRNCMSGERGPLKADRTRRPQPVQ